jgi:hypothetical protein
MARKLIDRLVAKLNPKAIRVSPMFHAILACMLGQSGWTNPSLAALTVTSDGFLLGMREGDYGFNDFLGSRQDLMDNLHGVADAADLTQSEKKKLLALAPTFTL